MNAVVIFNGFHWWVNMCACIIVYAFQPNIQIRSESNECIETNKTLYGLLFANGINKSAKTLAAHKTSTNKLKCWALACVQFHSVCQLFLAPKIKVRRLFAQQTISPDQINALSIRSKELVNYLCCTNNRIFFVGSVYFHRLNAAEKSLDNEDLLRTFLDISCICRSSIIQPSNQ